MNYSDLEQVYIVVVGLIGILTICIMAFSIASNKLVNLFMLIGLIILCTRMLLKGSYGLGLQSFAEDFAPKYRAIVNISLSLLYMYFKSIIFDYHKLNVRDLKHLIFPALLFGFNYICFSFSLFPVETIRLINLVLSTLLATFYLVKSYRLLKSRLWNGPIDLDYAHYALMKKWTIFLFYIFTVIIFRAIVSLIYEMSRSSELSGLSMTFVQASLWLIVFGKILISPQILFGLPRLSKIANSFREPQVDLDKHWQLEPSQISNQQDQKLKDKVDDKIVNFIAEIEYLVINNHFFRNQKMTVQDVANELNVPVSHVVYVFKYHCKLTFIEYKNLIKIEDAQMLIEEGFLLRNTLESLAIEVGFSSYNPFFTAFKKIVGMSPNEYSRSLKTKRGQSNQTKKGPTEADPLFRPHIYN
jgi:AraC-like DNA-binding protein